jgi:hypothetical protein
LENVTLEEGEQLQFAHIFNKNVNNHSLENLGGGVFSFSCPHMREIKTVTMCSTDPRSFIPVHISYAYEYMWEDNIKIVLK